VPIWDYVPAYGRDRHEGRKEEKGASYKRYGNSDGHDHGEKEMKIFKLI